jgi:hypothetical protein
VVSTTAGVDNAAPTSVGSVRWHLGPAATALLLIVAGVFAWAVLRAVAPIRNVIVDENIRAED